jgi:large subunit ribosomal protein L6
MSRVGKAPIKLPSGVEVKVAENEVIAKGSLGEMRSPLPDGITLEVSDGMVTLSRKDDSRYYKERHGLARALLNNNVLGVSTGWKKNLELVGVGYRVQLKGNELVFALGYSHEIRYPLPEGVKAQVTDQTKVELSGVDRQRVGQVAAEIRSFRPPEPYKGKGVKYADETIRRKAGKAGKAGKK